MSSTYFIYVLSLLPLGDANTLLISPADIVTALVSESVSEQDDSFRQACHMMLDQQRRGELERLLTGKIDTSNEPVILARVAMLLARAPSEEVVVVLLRRIQNSEESQTKTALCGAIRKILAGRPALSVQTRDALVKELVEVAKNRSSQAEAVDQVIFAIAALGKDGYDLLLDLRDKPSNPRIMNIFYSALIETQDPRILPVFRSVIDDPETRSGSRIQAVRGVGEFVERAPWLKINLDSEELLACKNSLHKLIDSTTDDVVFSVALKSLAKLSHPNKDARVYSAVVNSLGPESAERLQASLDIIYESGMELEPHIQTRIREIQDHTVDDGVRASASAIHDRLFAKAFSDESE